MISFLEGEIVQRSSGQVVIAVGGIGYEVAVPTSLLASLPAAGKKAKIHTRMVVRDDSIMLYGFTTPDQRELFDLLTGVTGVGPRVALSFLSALTPDDLRRAIAAGDSAAITIVPGVGKKLAQRVVVELRDRFTSSPDVVIEGPLSDVREALLSLGLTPAEALEAMSGTQADGRGTDELLREALKKVGR
jgi:Holliday junction DNA helicase, RuvA subunit